MKCYLNLTADVKEFSHNEKVKETSNLANDILTNSIDFGYEMSDMIAKDFLGDDYTFNVESKHRSRFTESAEFFDLEN